jgi:hypothetical protein
MELEPDVYKAAGSVIREFGVKKAAVKYALRMKRLLARRGNHDGAVEWQMFAVSLLRRIKARNITLH